MIRKILTTYVARLDEYLARSHRQPEGVAEVGLIGSAGEQCPNKLVVSLVNLEREASGDGGYMQRAATGYAGRRQPLCNLVDIGARGSAKTALQATAGPFSQNRLLLGHTSSSSVRNHCRGEVGLTPPDEDCGYQESRPAV